MAIYLAPSQPDAEAMGPGTTITQTLVDGGMMGNIDPGQGIPPGGFPARLSWIESGRLWRDVMTQQEKDSWSTGVKAVWLQRDGDLPTWSNYTSFQSMNHAGRMFLGRTDLEVPAGTPTAPIPVYENFEVASGTMLLKFNFGLWPSTLALTKSDCAVYQIKPGKDDDPWPLSWTKFAGWVEPTHNAATAPPGEPKVEATLPFPVLPTDSVFLYLKSRWSVTLAAVDYRNMLHPVTGFVEVVTT